MPRRAMFDEMLTLELAGEPVSARALGDMLRLLRLSAWKRFDAGSTIDRATFIDKLSRVLPSPFKT